MCPFVAFFDSLSFDPVSFDPVSFDPLSFDPLSVNRFFKTDKISLCEIRIVHLCS